MAQKQRYTKKEVLAACEGCMGICASVQRKLKISRRAFYNYRQRWPEVEEAIEEEQHKGLDFAESKLLELIKAGDFKAISFYLERKGRDRGWGAQQQINLQGNTPVQPLICFTGDEGGAGRPEGGGHDGGNSQQ